MAGYDKTIVVGRLGKDPEKRTTKNDKEVSTFSVAVDQGWGDNQRTEWYTVVLFDKRAEFANKYLSKGQWVVVEGQMRTDKYETREGETRYTTKLYGFEVRSVGPKPEGAGNGKGGGDLDDDIAGGGDYEY